jgi:ribA/ribD-fused uncharacterized protein
MKRIGNVTAFFSEFDDFSNFFRRDILIRSVVFNCNEQAFMYTKAMFFKDERKAQEILEAEMPWLQKKLGRQVRDFRNGENRPFNKPEWDRVSPHFMDIIVGEKLDQHGDIRSKLMRTEDTIIVEASETDLLWGAGVGIDDPRISDPTQWPGQNKLGQIFMKHRERYRG